MSKEIEKMTAIYEKHKNTMYAVALKILKNPQDAEDAVSEAVTNAIVHAYPQEIGKIALRACIFDGNLLEITVRDWGCGIADVEKAREPLYTTGGEERSGMGFTIMESFMDSLAVRSKNGKGTVVTMKRRIALRPSRR